MHTSLLSLIILTLLSSPGLMLSKKNPKKEEMKRELSKHKTVETETPGTDESSCYWESQKKHLVNPADFYGTFPVELEEWITVFQHKQDFAKVGLYKSSNFLFYGAPGTGKTYIASIFAQRLGAEFMCVQGDELLDKWQGAGLTKPTELFIKARARRDATKKPVVMFIDEIDTIVQSRNGYMHEGTLQLIGTLLKEIGAEVNNDIIVIVATNKIHLLDEALVRSGRFDHHIHFQLPGLYDRKKFLEFIIKPYPLIFDEAIDWNLIAQNTQGYTYADLRKLIDTIKRHYVLKQINSNSTDKKITLADIAQMDPKLVACTRSTIHSKTQPITVREQWSLYAYLKKVCGLK